MNFRIISAYGMVLGWGMAGIVKSMGLPLVEFKPDQFMYLLLPPIVLCSGFKFNGRRAQNTFGTSMAFAWLGTIGTTLWVSLALWSISDIEPWIVAFWIGAILSPTDPVGTLDMLRHVHDMEDVCMVLEHESLINDAVSVILVHMANHAYKLQMTKAEAIEIVAVAMGMTAVSFAIGVVFAYLISKIQSLPNVAICGMMMFSFSELIGASGIITLFVYGVALSKFGIEREIFETVKNVSEMCEIYVYVTMGFTFVMVDAQYISIGLNAVAACITGRMMNVFLFGTLSSLCGVKWSIKKILFMSTCGMRGAVSLALAVQSPDMFRTMFITITVIEVVASVIYTIIMNGFINNAL